MKVSVPTAEAMQDLGASLADHFSPGDLIILSGPVGAGKTTLAQGIARGLGVTDPVTSPTFVIAREHRGARFPFIHVDAYRLGSVRELDDLDLVSDVEDAVTVVEWGRGIAEGLAREHLVITIDRTDDVRTVTTTGHGGRWTGQFP